MKPGYRVRLDSQLMIWGGKEGVVVPEPSQDMTCDKLAVFYRAEQTEKTYLYLDDVEGGIVAGPYHSDWIEVLGGPGLLKRAAVMLLIALHHWIFHLFLFLPFSLFAKWHDKSEMFIRRFIVDAKVGNGYEPRGVSVDQSH